MVSSFSFRSLLECFLQTEWSKAFALFEEAELHRRLHHYSSYGSYEISEHQRHYMLLCKSFETHLATAELKLQSWASRLAEWCNNEACTPTCHRATSRHTTIFDVHCTFCIDTTTCVSQRWNHRRYEGENMGWTDQCVGIGRTYAWCWETSSGWTPGVRRSSWCINDILLRSVDMKEERIISLMYVHLWAGCIQVSL